MLLSSARKRRTKAWNGIWNAIQRPWKRTRAQAGPVCHLTSQWSGRLRAAHFSAAHRRVRQTLVWLCGSDSPWIFKIEELRRRARLGREACKQGIRAQFDLHIVPKAVFFNSLLASKPHDQDTDEAWTPIGKSVGVCSTLTGRYLGGCRWSMKAVKLTLRQ